MEPALPGPPPDGEPLAADVSDAPWISADEVGEFRQGSSTSRWALARYLVGRVIAESVSTTLFLIAAGILVLAVAVQVGLHLTVLAVLVALVAVVVLVLRWVLVAVLRRLTVAQFYGPISDRLRTLVSDTHRDVFRELRRLGLPSHTITLPLLAFRLAGRRRKATLTRLRDFDIDRAVPPARVDELHMLLGSAVDGRMSGRPGHGSPGAAR